MTSDAPRRMLAQVGFNQGRDQHDGLVHHMKDMCLRPNALGGLDQNTACRRPAEVGHVNGSLRNFSRHRTRLRDVPIAKTALGGILDPCIHVRGPARDLRFTSPHPRYTSTAGTPPNSSRKGNLGLVWSEAKRRRSNNQHTQRLH